MGNWKIGIEGRDYKVQVNRLDEDSATVTVDGQAYEVSFASEEIEVREDLQPLAAILAAPVAEPESTNGPSPVGLVKSPLPGMVLALPVRLGQSVRGVR